MQKILFNNFIFFKISYKSSVLLSYDRTESFIIIKESKYILSFVTFLSNSSKQQAISLCFLKIF